MERNKKDSQDDASSSGPNGGVPKDNQVDTEGGRSLTARSERFQKLKRVLILTKTALLIEKERKREGDTALTETIPSSPLYSDLNINNNERKEDEQTKENRSDDTNEKKTDDNKYDAQSETERMEQSKTGPRTVRELRIGLQLMGIRQRRKSEYKKEFLYVGAYPLKEFDLSRREDPDGEEEKSNEVCFNVHSRDPGFFYVRMESRLSSLDWFDSINHHAQLAKESKQRENSGEPNLDKRINSDFMENYDGVD